MDPQERIRRWCALSERCSSEVKRKLYQLEVIGQKAEEELEALQREGFVDDSRFAFAFARSKMRYNAWGKTKIIASLRALRLPESLIQEAILDLDKDEYSDLMERQLEKKFLALVSRGQRAVAYNKLYAFAISKGYDSSIAQRHIKKLLAERDEQED